RVAVLRLAADLVALRDDLGGITHHHVDAGQVLLHPGVRVAVALGHRDRFHAAADHDVGAVVDDVVRGDRDGLEARGAEAVQREPGDRHREPRAHRRHAGDVVALRAVRLAAAHDHVLDLFRVELRHLAEDVLDAVGGEIVGAREVERATERLGERRPRAGDDDGFSHDGLLAFQSRLDGRDGHDLDQVLGRRQPRLHGRPRRGVRGIDPGVPGGVHVGVDPMLATYTVAERIFDLWLPTAASVSSIFLRICWVWPL